MHPVSGYGFLVQGICFRREKKLHEDLARVRELQQQLGVLRTVAYARAKASVSESQETQPFSTLGYTAKSTRETKRTSFFCSSLKYSIRARVLLQEIEKVSFFSRVQGFF